MPPVSPNDVFIILILSTMFLIKNSHTLRAKIQRECTFALPQPSTPIIYDIARNQKCKSTFTRPVSCLQHFHASFADDDDAATATKQVPHTFGKCIIPQELMSSADNRDHPAQ